MTINNQSRAGWIKLSYYLLIFLYLASIVILLYLNTEKRFEIIGGISAILFAIIVFSLYLDFNYIIFKEGSQQIILRYYPLHPFHDKFKSIEIQKNSLLRYELESNFMGLKPTLTLYQNTNQGIAKYPKVCLSALSKKNRKAILQSLEANSIEKKQH